MASEKPWRFSETRPIHPFRVSEHALDAAAFKTRDDAPFSNENPWNLTVEPEEIASDTFKPRMKLGVDRDRLAQETGLELPDLQLTVIARDPALWRAEKIAGWDISDCPDEFEIPETVLKSFSGARGLQFSVQISPSKQLAVSFRTAHSPGHIVASRDFSIAIPSDGSDFPVDMVDPSEFVKRGLPEETVWVVHWLSESDFDQPAEEVLVVLINKEHGDKLLRLSGSDTVAAVLWTEIATEVFVEIALVVLRSEPPEPQHKDGLLRKIVSRLQKDTGLSRDELITRAKDPLRATAFVRAHLQKGLELANRVARISLVGRS